MKYPLEINLRNMLSLFALLACALALYGCGTQLPAQGAISTPTLATTSAVATPTGVPSPVMPPQPTGTWVPPTALVGTPIPGAEATLTAAPQLKTGLLTITNSKGESVNMTVEIADTGDARQLGLMFRPSMPPDAGMLFDFGEDTNGGFWMQNTILPLSIAFIKADGAIIDVKDMQPLDTTSVGPSGPYRYALEANQGFYRAHGIATGDKVTLPGAGAFIPGMPACALPGE